jgi:hypothetical protein
MLLLLLLLLLFFFFFFFPDLHQTLTLTPFSSQGFVPRTLRD